MPKFDVKVELLGKDSNAFVLIGITRTALRRAGASSAEISEFTAEATSGDYNNVLNTIGKWVEIT